MSALAVNPARSRVHPVNTCGRRFVVLDRDGTLIVERHYLADPAEVALLPGAAAALRALRAAGLGLVVVTNQSAIGRGLLDEARLALIHGRLEALLAAEGVALDGIYVCPHQPADGCRCRKPATGLLERAAAALGFDAGRAFVVGDKDCDVELGRRAGATTFLVRTGHGAEAAGGADHVVEDLGAAAAVITRLCAAGGTSMPSNEELARAHLLASAELKREVAASLTPLLAAADLIARALAHGGTLLLCGNGGSAADCQHLAAELVNRSRAGAARPGLAAIALTTDTSFLTAYANDCGFDGVFARQVETLGRPGDVLLAITTSGTSPNVLAALGAARQGGLATIVLTGAAAPGGGAAAPGGLTADVVVAVPSRVTALVQETHLALEHILCELVEQALFGAPA